MGKDFFYAPFVVTAVATLSRAIRERADTQALAALIVIASLPQTPPTRIQLATNVMQRARFSLRNQQAVAGAGQQRRQA
jgi:hypothetical protein